MCLKKILASHGNRSACRKPQWLQKHVWSKPGVSEGSQECLKLTRSVWRKPGISEENRSAWRKAGVSEETWISEQNRDFRCIPRTIYCQTFFIFDADQMGGRHVFLHGGMVEQLVPRASSSHLVSLWPEENPTNPHLQILRTPAGLIPCIACLSPGIDARYLVSHLSFPLNIMVD